MSLRARWIRPTGPAPGHALLFLPVLLSAYAAPVAANERNLDLADTAGFLGLMEADRNRRERFDDWTAVPDLEQGRLQYQAFLAITPPSSRYRPRDQYWPFYIWPADVTTDYQIEIGWTDNQNRPTSEVTRYMQTAVAGVERLRAYDDRAQSLGGAQLFEQAANLAANTQLALYNGDEGGLPIHNLGDLLDVVDEVVHQVEIGLSQPNRPYSVPPGRRLELFEAIDQHVRTRPRPEIALIRLADGRYDASIFSHYLTMVAGQVDLGRAPIEDQDRVEDRTR
jgi:hypothetical protein